jgi:hypothetical protein
MARLRMNSRLIHKTRWKRVEKPLKKKQPQCVLTHFGYQPKVSTIGARRIGEYSVAVTDVEKFTIQKAGCYDT